MKTIYILKIAFFTLMGFLLTGCDKYLDVKPDKSMVVPTSVADLKALLDNTDRMNASNPCVQDGATDNSYVIPATWLGLTEITSKNMYVWGDDVFNDGEINEWSMPYTTVFYANLVLEQLEKINPIPSEKANMQGAALVFRSFAFYQIAQLFAKPYDDATASSDLGIPLRLKSDINEKSFRATVEETYLQIVSDLKQASALLPTTATYKTTPTKPAALGLLARVFLSMGDYINAEIYADSCLKFNNSLLDLNTEVTLTAGYPFARNNKEVIFHSSCFGRTVLSVTYGRVDQELYKSYKSNDLRKIGFFRNRIGTYSFKGGYDGTSTPFNGISTNELYLIKAECAARNGSLPVALENINTLLKKRYSNVSYQAFNTASRVEALDFILAERRKELLFRGLRWTDLRRLNKESHYAITIKRELNNQIYELLPNSNKYVLPIPKSVIANNGMMQNKR